MLNIKPQILKILESALKGEKDLEVYHADSEDWAKKRIVTYKEIWNTTHRKVAGNEKLANIEIEIRTWAEIPSQVSRIMQKLDKKISKTGLLRGFTSPDMKDPNGRWNKISRYKGYVDVDTERVFN